MIAPHGWMNDPCAPGYDSVANIYHLSFQWSPERDDAGHVVWNDIAWGHATSPDLISWKIKNRPVLKPGKYWYDKQGCFTGCMYPTAVHGGKGLTVFYTGASRLPINYRLPYTRQTETLNMVQLSDDASFWVKEETNPILLGPPAQISVTGWRDPMVAIWKSLDVVLGRDPDQGNLYGLISGGVKDCGPTVFLYEIDKGDLAKWTYLCELIDIEINRKTSRWSGDTGVNWECGNFATLTDGGVSRELIIVGVEGLKKAPSDQPCPDNPNEVLNSPRDERSQQWMCGRLTPQKAVDGNPAVPKLEHTMSGHYDHGLAYGCNSFTDPKSSRQIVFAWITEDDLPQELVDKQGWSGLISLPRVVGLQTLQGVTGAFSSPLSSITSIEVEPDPSKPGSHTVRTLSISPVPQVSSLRSEARELSISQPQDLHAFTADPKITLPVMTYQFEIDAVFEVNDTCQRIGLSILHTEENSTIDRLEVSTNIIFHPNTETLSIERPSSSIQCLNKPDTRPEQAPFTLFEFADQIALPIPAPSGIETETSISPRRREQLHIRAWWDESVLEVFANDRCVISTRIYPATSRCRGVRFWAEDGEEGPDGDGGGRTRSRLVRATVWDGLSAAISVVD